MIATTYQHDYIPPLTKRYDFGKHKETIDESKGCQPTRESNMEASKTARKESNVEWTGIAPMGRLIRPRNIPTKLSNKQLDDMFAENQANCHQEQQNRFLKILPLAYPELYHQLKEMSSDEFIRRLDNDRMCTTYQIDFCDINEYSEGTCKTLKTSEDKTRKLKLNGEKAALESDNMKSNDWCEKSYKPFKISFVDSSRFINSGNNSHWRSKLFTKKANFSEYMDTISKIGCAITKNNIHDHQRCNKRNCRHEIIHACTNMK